MGRLSWQVKPPRGLCGVTNEYEGRLTRAERYDI